MDNVTKLTAAPETKVTPYDPLDEIMSFYEQAEVLETKELSQTEESLFIDPTKINFLDECEKLIGKIEDSQKRSNFYLNEIYNHLDQD